MDFYDQLIEINVQLADAFQKLHTLNIFSAKKIFLNTAKNIFSLASENKHDRKLYDKLMDLFAFSISGAGIDKKELEKITGGNLPPRLTFRILFSDNFASSSKGNFHEELNAIFESSPFVTEEITMERIKSLCLKYNIQNPTSKIIAITS